MKKTNLEVVYRKTADLIPFINNARTHSDEQVTQIASSIQHFGFNNPILIDSENGVVAGHGRLEAAKKLGLETVPTIELKGLSEAEKRAYILADNKIAINSSWDIDTLTVEMEALKDLDFDLSLTGFSNNELNGLFGVIDEAELPSAEIEEKHDVIVSFSSDIEAEDFFNEMEERGLNCRLSM